MRPAAAAALIGSLAAAWLVAGRHAAAPASPTGPAPLVTTATLRTRLAHPEQCADVAAPMPTVRCVVAGVIVEVRELDADVATAYAREVTVARRAHTGPPQCARGHAEERSWSRPSAPARVVGRYACGHEHQRAAMWWTDDHGLLWHAVARDDNLAALFSWWQRHPVL